MHASRRSFLGIAGAAGVAGVVTFRGGQAGHETVRVPRDEPTVQAGVDAAGEGDLVLVAPGTYEEVVDVTTPGITVRGRDRNRTVFDGGEERHYAIHVAADGVALENLTAHHCTATPFYWTEIEGFRGSYLTAYNDGDYGIYAYRSRDGRFEHCYASGHPDAGFYLGRNHPFEAVVTNCTAEYNAWGYSGTSAGGDLTVEDSTFRRNQAGIVPNTLDTYDDPQREARIVGNVVEENDNPDAPTKAFPYPAFGTGICLWGASTNVVEANEVHDHENFGVAAAPNVEPPAGNVVTGNVVSGSGVADLALAAPAGDGNEFSGNAVVSALPPDLQDDASTGSPEATRVFESQRETARAGEYPSGDWRDQPEPGDRPTMPDPEADPKPAGKEASWPAP